MTKQDRKGQRSRAKHRRNGQPELATGGAAARALEASNGMLASETTLETGTRPGLPGKTDTGKKGTEMLGSGITAKRPRILLLVHNYPNRGGVEEHTRSLARGLCNEFHLMIAWPDGQYIRLIEDDRVVASFRSEAMPFPIAPYRSLRFEHAFDQVLRRAAPDLIHVVHFLHWPLELIGRSCDTGLPVVVSFHDYFAITPHFTLQGFTEPAHAITLEGSIKCFRRDVSVALMQRIEILNRDLKRAKLLIVPHPVLADALRQFYDFPFSIVEYGIEPFQSDTVPTTSTRVRFGYLGALIPQKGWEVAVEGLEKLVAAGANAELILYGGTQTVPPALRDHLRFGGPFSRDNLHQLTQTFDVGIVPSLFPETYCMVLSELWHAGIPAIVSDIGALGPRMRDAKFGQTFPAGDSSALAQAMGWFLDHHEWKSWSAPRVRLADEMCQEYRGIYRSLFVAATKSAA